MISYLLLSKGFFPPKSLGFFPDQKFALNFHFNRNDSFLASQKVLVRFKTRNRLVIIQNCFVRNKTIRLFGEIFAQPKAP